MGGYSLDIELIPALRTVSLSPRERIPRKGLFAPWTPEPKSENTQHPTSNIEHPKPRVCAIIGCWAFDVGCWMFPRFRGKVRVRGNGAPDCIDTSKNDRATTM